LPFDEEVSKPEPFTADRRKLKGEIETLRPGGQTALFDATYTAVATLLAAQREGKRAVVVLTDGEDNRSHRRAQEAIKIAKKAGIPLHMIGLGRAGEIDEKIMQRMAAETGGT